ncbi:MAG TPA: hypothetical protein VND93_10550 [Myxococcales bacterium]|nr:hypothetical protein [Myxococcales bacterium]
MLRAALLCSLAAIAGCLPSSNIEGLEFACDAGADCEPGFRCWRGACTQDPGFPLGAPCSIDDDCANRTCSGGVCCSRRCDGACQACDRGPPGQCDPLPAGSAGSPSCAPYFCDGTRPFCPNGCAGDPDCGPGTYCDAGACTPLGALGASCSRGGTCDSGLCVDARCCDAPCTGPCDACNVAGRLGRCSTSPLGRVPSPSCGDYACNGTFIGCPTSCASDAGCLSGFSCSTYNQQCQPKVETLADPFTGTVLDAGTWAVYRDAGTGVAQANNRLELTVTPASGGGYCGIYTNRTYDGLGSRIGAQLVVPGDQSIASYETYFQYLAPDNRNRFGFHLSGGTLHMQEQLGGAYSEPVAPVTYNPAVHRFLRLRTDGGAAIWESSVDGGSYTAIGATASRPWMQSIYVELGAGNWAPEDAGTTAAWDNVRR